MNLIFDELVPELRSKKLNIIEQVALSTHEFHEKMEYLLEKAKEGNKILLHIFSHGDENGLYFSKTKEHLFWKEIAELFSEINTALNNTFLLNMTVCKGLHIYNMNIYFPNACYGVIGSNKDLTVLEAEFINKAFYEGLVKGEKIQTIVQNIQHLIVQKCIYDSIDFICSEPVDNLIFRPKLCN